MLTLQLVQHIQLLFNSLPTPRVTNLRPQPYVTASPLLTIFAYFSYRVFFMLTFTRLLVFQTSNTKPSIFFTLANETSANSIL